ncbi:unnamed protein product [Victoria cruziana]
MRYTNHFYCLPSSRPKFHCLPSLHLQSPSSRNASKKAPPPPRCFLPPSCARPACMLHPLFFHDSIYVFLGRINVLAGVESYMGSQLELLHFIPLAVHHATAGLVGYQRWSPLPCSLT